MSEVKVAVIESAHFDTDRGLLSAWLQLSYSSGSGQGFGGYALYLPNSYSHANQGGNYAGHFIWRCLQIAGVGDWSELKGQYVRVKATDSKVEAIGHIMNDDWFSPDEEFLKLNRR